MKIDAIIWSKDRAAQLDLLLRSIKDNFCYIGNLYVLYDFSNTEFENGYSRIMSKDYGFKINFVRQYAEIFKHVTVQTTNALTSDYFLNFCDDDVVIRNINIEQAIKHYDNDTCAFSLRAGLNMKMSYHKNVLMKKPKTIIQNEDVIKWNWREGNIDEDWGYPYGIAAFIYDRKSYLNKINKIDFTNANVLENAMMRLGTNLNYLKSFDEIKILNLSVNRIQSTYGNKAGEKFSYTTKQLNDIFLGGKTIDTKNIYNYQPDCEFVELEFVFK